jgi:hypothetical protein
MRFHLTKGLRNRTPNEQYFSTLAQKSIVTLPNLGPVISRDFRSST